MADTDINATISTGVAIAVGFDGTSIGDVVFAGTSAVNVSIEESFGIAVTLGYGVDGSHGTSGTSGSSGTSGTSPTVASVVSDTAYGTSWDGVTDVAPSKNAVYDKIELLAPKASPTFTTDATSPKFIQSAAVNNFRANFSKANAIGNGYGFVDFTGTTFTWTEVRDASSVFDHNSATAGRGKFTVPAGGAGLYFFCAELSVFNSGSADAWMGFRIHDATKAENIAFFTGSSYYVTLGLNYISISGQAYLNDGDTVYIGAFHNGSSQVIDVSGVFYGFRVI